MNQGDIGAYLQFTRLGNESKKLALTQAREERLQQERPRASEEERDLDSDFQASSPPGMALRSSFLISGKMIRAPGGEKTAVFAAPGRQSLRI